MRRYGRGIAEVGCFPCCFGQVRGAAEEGFHLVSGVGGVEDVAADCRCLKMRGGLRVKKEDGRKFPVVFLHIQMTYCSVL